MAMLPVPMSNQVVPSGTRVNFLSVLDSVTAWVDQRVIPTAFTAEESLTSDTVPSLAAGDARRTGVGNDTTMTVQVACP